MSPSSMLARCTSASVRAIGSGNRVLDQTFLQSNPQIAGHDLDDVLGFERRRAGNQIADDSCLRRRPACSPQSDEMSPPLPTRPRPDQRVREGPLLPPLPDPHAGDKRSVSSPSSFPASSATICHSARPPTCSVVSSQAGNARPERKTADTAASSVGRDFR